MNSRAKESLLPECCESCPVFKGDRYETKLLGFAAGSARLPGHPPASAEIGMNLPDSRKCRYDSSQCPHKRQMEISQKM